MQQDAVECAGQVGNAEKFSRMRLEGVMHILLTKAKILELSDYSI